MKKALTLIIGTLLSTGTGLAIAQTGGSGGSTEGKPIHKADAASKDAHKKQMSGNKATKGGKKATKGGKKGTATTEVKPGGPGVPPPTRPPSNPQ